MGSRDALIELVATTDGAALQMREGTTLGSANTCGQAWAKFRASVAASAATAGVSTSAHIRPMTTIRGGDLEPDRVEPAP